MKLDLREIIEIPGGRIPFQCELDPAGLDFPAVIAFRSAPQAEGVVVNTAGALSLVGQLHLEMLCICDRCGREFSMDKTMELHLPLAAEGGEEENPDLFLLEGDSLNLTEVLETCLILDMETKFLCREDCKGLCETCGADLNEGPCTCRKISDPRMAVLEQLLDK